MPLIQTTIESFFTNYSLIKQQEMKQKEMKKRALVSLSMPKPTIQINILDCWAIEFITRFQPIPTELWSFIDGVDQKTLEQIQETITLFYSKFTTSTLEEFYEFINCNYKKEIDIRLVYHYTVISNLLKRGDEKLKVVQYVRRVIEQEPLFEIPIRNSLKYLFISNESSFLMKEDELLLHTCYQYSTWYLGKSKLENHFTSSASENTILNLYTKVKRHLEYRGYLINNENTKTKLLNQFIAILTARKRNISNKFKQLFSFINEYFVNLTFENELKSIWNEMEFCILLCEGNTTECLKLIRKYNLIHLAIQLIILNNNSNNNDSWIGDLEKRILKNVPQLITILQQQMHIEESVLEQDLKCFLSKVIVNYSFINEMIINETGELFYRKGDLKRFIQSTVKEEELSDDDENNTNTSQSSIPDNLSIEIICETFSLGRQEAIALFERYNNSLSNVLTAIFR